MSKIINPYRFGGTDPDNPGKTDLAAYYGFDETSGTICYDEHTNDYDGTITGATINQTGKVGKCYEYDGSSSFIQASSDALPFERTDEFSVSFWANQHTVSAGGIISNEGNTTNYPGILVLFLNDVLYIQLRANLYATRIITTMPLGNLNTWVHYVVTYNGNSSSSGIKMYKDGVEQTVTTLGDNLTASIVTGADVFIGKRASSIHYFDGEIDELSIYSKILTSYNVEWLYNNSNGRSYQDLS